MPKRRDVLDAGRLAAAVPGVVPPSYGGRLIKLWDALLLFIDEGLLTNSDADKAWLKLIFRGREMMSDTELRAEIAARTSSSNVAEMQRRA